MFMIFMAKKLLRAVMVFFFATSLAVTALCEEKEEIRFDFETGAEGWVIPDWVFDQNKINIYRAVSVDVSSEEASSGSNSLEIMCDFPGREWAAALVELQRDFDFSSYDTISVDIYVPRKAPRLIEGRIILTVGDGWLFTEMRNSVYLQPGKWTTVTAHIEKEQKMDPETGAPALSEWKGRGDKSLYLHIDKIKKVAIRIEYNAAPPDRTGPRYKGPMYVDNIVIK